MLDVFLAGLVAEWVRKIILAPLDTLTVRLQVERDAQKGRSRNPLVRDAAGIVQQLRQPMDLYSGLGLGLISAVPQAMVYMPTYELCSTILRGSSVQVQLASVATGIACSIVRVPTGVIKTRIQCGVGPASQVIADAIACGWADLYVGWRASCLLDILHAVIQFTALEQFRRLAQLTGGGPATDAVVGLLTGFITAAATEPLDVVVTRLRVQHRGPSDKHDGVQKPGYSGLLDALRRIAREEGFVTLWRGVLPRFMYRALGSFIWYPVYVQARELFSMVSSTSLAGES